MVQAAGGTVKSRLLVEKTRLKPLEGSEHGRLYRGSFRDLKGDFVNTSCFITGCLNLNAMGSFRKNVLSVSRALD